MLAHKLPCLRRKDHKRWAQRQLQATNKLPGSTLSRCSGTFPHLYGSQGPIRNRRFWAQAAPTGQKHPFKQWAMTTGWRWFLANRGRLDPKNMYFTVRPRPSEQNRNIAEQRQAKLDVPANRPSAARHVQPAEYTGKVMHEVTVGSFADDA